MEVQPMKTLLEILALLGPRPFPAEGVSRARRLFLACSALLAALACAAIWGVAAGSAGGHFALMNAVSVPLIVLASSVAALPLALAVFRLTTLDGRASDLVLGHAAALFGACLLLALLAPVIALYQHSSSWAGPVVAIASVVAATALAVAFLVRVLGKLAPESRARRGMLVPVILLSLLQVAALLQLAAIAPPVMPHRTVLGRGVDVLSRSDAAEER
jgi:hypothetical protein